MAELIITEKPKSALKIALALADGKPIKESNQGVPYYKVTHNKKDIIVACAVGHLYGLEEKEKNGWHFPVFDVEWKPIYEKNKKSDFSRKYLQTIKKLAKQAKEFTIATDYDIEGETIGLNIIRYTCNQKDAARMKFSTLTKPDLINAYEHKSPHLDWGQAEAGETRHEMDWYWGINTSRALTSAIKQAGVFKILSTGRVQGPALKIIVDREKEIKAFKPVPFWQIELNGKVKRGNIIAWHKEDKFWKKEEVDRVMEKIKVEKKGKVENLEKKQFKQTPPNPFDLTSLQIEAYRCLRISPKETLAIAQELYTSGYISYPRTSSQQLPIEIGYKNILNKLSKQTVYNNLLRLLLNKSSLIPNNGKKTDPAHPAIYPTGILPSDLKKDEQRVYDLIVRRFMATFGDNALRETMKIYINVKDEIFIAKGTRTIEKGWHIFYEPYLKLEEEELPVVIKDDIVDIKKFKLHEKETQPPKRYTPASIIKELEKKNLGTKSTRAEIIDTLYKRGYIESKAIEATELGMKTIETLEKYSPKIIDEALTGEFEADMELIREKKKKGKEILERARNLLVNIFDDFKRKEKDIGKGLLEANKETQKKATTVGKCPNCNNGELIIRKGKFGRFIACNKYPDCQTTFNLPNKGSVKVSEKVCQHCKFPIIVMLKKGKKPQEICINKECSSKIINEKIEEKPCPKCKQGKLILRKSVYGSFLACDRYPKCRYTESITNNEKSSKK
jgi:DNA topoisomerase-1